MVKSKEPVDGRGRTRLIRFEDLQPGDEVNLGPDDRIVLPVRTIREAVGDVDEVEWIDPEGAMTVYLEMIEIFGQGAVGATATCQGLPDEYCRVIATVSHDGVVGFACVCDWPEGSLPPQPPKCELQLGPNLTGGSWFGCNSNSCTGTCVLKIGWTPNRKFGLICQCQ